MNVGYFQKAFYMCNTSKALLPKPCDDDKVPQKQTSLVKVTKEIVRAHTSFLQSS